ncbi:hypothetical protein HNP84_002187 [Thermocatellispora tengchongensis]|uniref:DUF7824 domain-containing protein n=2 Tax=Thermocatellispora tengchongensis TaxID=1073253 RepID=A0A840P3N2_9ACTN|nr:DUF6493 family protein [Thermocatellispora tengchongensis]MBB5132471.1 hypothetical protein [Thermocatellispora tengchongensis]
MDHWGEIEKLIEQRYAARLAERVTELDSAARKDVAARLPGLLKKLKGRFEESWDGALAPYATVLRVAGAATLGGAAAVASWLYRRDFAPQWDGPDNDVELILAVTADRPAAWRADLAERLVLRMRTGDDRGMPLALAMVRQTGIDPPRHDPLVVGWVQEVPPEPPYADPLIDTLLPRLFEAEGVGRALQWWRETDQGWLGALLKMAEAGRVGRESLIEGCVHRFLLGGSATDLRFFARLHEALAPAPEEVEPRVRDYVRLLAASPGPVAEAAVKHLRAQPALDPGHLAEIWDSLLFRPERKLVKAGLTWLDRAVRRDPALAGRIAAPLARAFAAESAELRERAVTLALAHVAAMGEQGRATVREAIPLLPAELGERAAAAFPGAEVAVEEAEPAPPPLPEPPPRATRLPAPIETAAEFAEVLAGERDWAAWERLLAGFVVLAHRDREALLAVLRGEMYRNHYARLHVYKQWDHADYWLMAAARTLDGASPVAGAWRDRLPRDRPIAPPALLLLHRVAEIHKAAEEGTLPPLLLATPTLSTGHVEAAELVRRLEVLEAAGVKPPAADLQQALLRLPRTPDPEAMARAGRLTSGAARIVAAWTCPEAEVSVRWHAPDECFEPEANAAPTGLPLVDLVLGKVRHHDVQGTHLAWWPATLPSHREVAAAHLLPYLLPSYWSPVLGDEVTRLVRAEGPVGSALALLLARMLADPRRPEEVEPVLELAARGELPAAELGRQLALLLRVGRVRMGELVTGLDTLAREGGHAQAWQATAAALPLLLPATGKRPRHGLAGLLALATTLATWCGARGEIPEVRDTAARAGSSDLVREARRLHALLTAPKEA